VPQAAAPTIVTPPVPDPGARRLRGPATASRGLGARARATPAGGARAAAILAALVFSTAAARAAVPAAGTLSAAAAEVASLVASQAPAPEVLAVLVTTPGSEGLAGPLATALGEALARRGFAVAPLAAAPSAAEEAARALEADRLLRVTAGLVPGRRQLFLAAELVPVRASFFLQRAPAVRPGSSRLWTLGVRADEPTLLLARAGARSGPGGASLWVRPLFRVPETVLALAIGDPAGDGSTSLVLVTPGAVAVFTPGGGARARHPLEPPVSAPRHPAGTAVVGALGPGRVAVQLAGAPTGVLFRLDEGGLVAVAQLPLAPLSASDAGALYGAFVPGKAALADLLAPVPDPAVRPTSPLEHAAFASAPRAGRVAHAWVSGDGVLTLLGPRLEPVGIPVDGVGAGAALADLDGDGEPELVASLTEAASEDKVRVLRWSASGGADAPPLLMLESARLPGSIRAGAAGDLTGDGLDDAVVAALLPGGGTQLWLVTADPRFAEVQ